MKAEGPRHERETVIVFNEEEETASVWTASDVVYRYMTKRGYKAAPDSGRSAWFIIPKAHVPLPRPKKKVSEATRKAFSERLSKLRKPTHCVEMKGEVDVI